MLIFQGVNKNQVRKIHPRNSTWNLNMMVSNGNLLFSKGPSFSDSMFVLGGCKTYHTLIKAVLKFRYPQNPRLDPPMEGWMQLYSAGVFLGPQNNIFWGVINIITTVGNFKVSIIIFFYIIIHRFPTIRFISNELWVSQVFRYTQELHKYVVFTYI